MCERGHRTIREEVSLDPEATQCQVQQLIEGFWTYCNACRPHSAVRHLRRVDDCRGDPQTHLASDACLTGTTPCKSRFVVRTSVRKRAEARTTNIHHGRQY